MDLIQYNLDNRSFSKLKLPSGFKKSTFQFKWKPKSDISKLITPILMNTSYKFTPYPSIESAGVSEEFKKRQIYLMNKLKKLHPKVNILLAGRYDNGCYIADLDKVLLESGVTEDGIKDFCIELGLDYVEFKKKLGPDLVILGPQFNNAVILAHELGHYINYRGLGAKNAHKHQKLYSASFIWSNLLNKLRFGTSIGTPILAAVVSNIGTDEFFDLVGVGFIGSGLLGYSSIIASYHMIMAEWNASSYGLRDLTLCGVVKDSDEYKSYRKALKDAFGTYSSDYILIPLAKSTITTAIGAWDLFM